MRLFCYQFVTRIALSNKKISIFAIGNKNKNISMAKKKQEAKLKEPVRIRFKQLANGNQSIYLDYYTGDVILWNENKIMSVSSGHLTIKLSNFLIDIIKIAECFVYKI